MYTEDYQERVEHLRKGVQQVESQIRDQIEKEKKAREG